MDPLRAGKGGRCSACAGIAADPGRNPIQMARILATYLLTAIYRDFEQVRRRIGAARADALEFVQPRF